MTLELVFKDIDETAYVEIMHVVNSQIGRIGGFVNTGEGSGGTSENRTERHIYGIDRVK